MNNTSNILTNELARPDTPYYLINKRLTNIGVSIEIVRHVELGGVRKGSGSDGPSKFEARAKLQAATLETGGGGHRSKEREKGGRRERKRSNTERVDRDRDRVRNE